MSDVICDRLWHDCLYDLCVYFYAAVFLSLLCATDEVDWIFIISHLPTKR